MKELNRRDFIKGAFGLGAASALTAVMFVPAASETAIINAKNCFLFIFPSLFSIDCTGSSPYISTASHLGGRCPQMVICTCMQPESGQQKKEGFLSGPLLNIKKRTG